MSLTTYSLNSTYEHYTQSSTNLSLPHYAWRQDKLSTLYECLQRIVSERHGRRLAGDWISSPLSTLYSWSTQRCGGKYRNQLPVCSDVTSRSPKKDSRKVPSPFVLFYNSSFDTYTVLMWITIKGFINFCNSRKSLCYALSFQTNRHRWHEKLQTTWKMEV